MWDQKCQKCNKLKSNLHLPLTYLPLEIFCCGLWKLSLVTEKLLLNHVIFQNRLGGEVTGLLPKK